MSIIIELAPAEMQYSSAFSRNAEVVAVFLVSASFSGPDSFPRGVREPLSTSISFAPKETALRDDEIRATTSFEYLISKSPKHRPDEVIVRIECLVAATYKLRPGYTPTEAELKAFHKANVIFNCWPYFREFVQNATIRMNVPPPPVPFVKVQIKNDQVQTFARTNRKVAAKKDRHSTVKKSS
jgi:hypothetical protein